MYQNMRFHESPNQVYCEMQDDLDYYYEEVSSNNSTNLAEDDESDDKENIVSTFDG